MEFKSISFLMMKFSCYFFLLHNLSLGTSASDLSDFPPPNRLKVPMFTAFRQINSAQPVDPYPRSKDALSLPLLTIDEPAADSIMLDIKEGIQYIFQTRNDWTLAVHGTGTTGAHAVLDNLLEPGDTALILINGYWGQMMANMSERIGANVIRYSSAPGTTISLTEIASLLLIYRPNVLAIVYGESSTTVRQPLNGIGDLCEKYGTLFVVDVVAVAGMEPIFMDKRKIDAVYASGHKGIGAAAGLAPVSLSPKAVAKILGRMSLARAYQTDLILQADLWNTTDPDRVRFQTLSMPLLYSLREALATIAVEGVENTYARQRQATMQLSQGLEALGLQYYVANPKNRMTGITAVYPPRGKDPTKVASYMFDNYNIQISSGFGPTRKQVLRFATFATNADFQRVSKLLNALEAALKAPETNV